VPPLVERFHPAVLVTQQGIDSHFTDPLTHLQVSTRAREHVVRAFAGFRLPWVAMGGGGYELDAVARGWSIEYLVMLGAPIPEELHDHDPPVWIGDERDAIDVATDVAVRDALAAAFT
jgi:acetoin utilization protein AcuC